MAKGRIRWLPPTEGGRIAPPPGPVFATTARFAKGEFPDIFSVMFRFVSSLTEDLEQDVEMDILALDMVEDALQPGRTLLVLEGFDVVGHLQLTDVFDPQR